MAKHHCRQRGPRMRNDDVTLSTASVTARLGMVRPAWNNGRDYQLSDVAAARDFSNESLESSTIAVPAKVPGCRERLARRLYVDLHIFLGV